MSKLFNAELHRLLHFRLYIIECVVFILFPIYTILLNDYGDAINVDGFIFQILPFLGCGLAVVVSQFIGEEYSCGTIRNKLFTGHTRFEIYFTQLILHFLASVNVLNLSIVTAIASGLIRGWKCRSSFRVLFGCYLVCFCTVFLLAAISVFVSLLNSSKIASLLLLLGISAGLLLVGKDFYSKLKQPEMRAPYDFEIEEGKTEMVPNRLYVSGNMRMGHEVLLLLNPYGQATYEVELMYDNYEDCKRTNFSKVAKNPHLKIFLYAGLESTFFTVIGITVFKKKQIK